MYTVCISYNGVNAGRSKLLLSIQLNVPN